MSNDLNRVIIVGRMTKDPDLRNTSSGTAVCGFTVACNRSYKTSDGNKSEEASFFNCVAWAKTAELVSQYCKKGKQVAIEGRLQQRSYENKDGVRVSVVEIVVETIQFLGGGVKTESPETPPLISDDDMPF